MGWLLGINRHLQGYPDRLLTLALLFLAGVLILIALRAQPAFKAGALAWVVLP